MSWELARCLLFPLHLLWFDVSFVDLRCNLEVWSAGKGHTLCHRSLQSPDFLRLPTSGNADTYFRRPDVTRLSCHSFNPIPASDPRRRGQRE